MRLRNIFFIITACVIGSLIYYQIADVLYWIKRVPLDASSVIAANERRVDCVVSGIEEFYNHHGYVPRAIHELKSDSHDRRAWVLLVNDEWGRLIGYTADNSKTGITVRVWSYGSDGKPGGTNTAQDILREWKVHSNTNAVISSN
jgi:hypothetical protein